MTSIRIEQLNKSYKTRDGSIPALEDIDLTVEEGEFVSIVGPSGCGKSTLLYMLAGFERPTDGRTIVAGQDMKTVRAARAKFLGTHRPASTAVFISQLVDPKLFVECEAIAAKKAA